MVRVIMHIDMNCFYASVEELYYPEYQTRPLAIAGNPKNRHGVIVTANYHARAAGVKTTMTVGRAKQLCPNIVFLPPDFSKYKLYSNKIFQMLRQYTSEVEPVSIDEGYVDLSAFDNPVQVAQQIQKHIKENIGLGCSIGIAPNKFLAKMASNIQKPNGFTILRKRQIKEILWPMSLIHLHGCGKKTSEKLEKIGIHTIGDLAQTSQQHLVKLLGVVGQRLHERANGIDDRPVDPTAIYQHKSFGQSKTFSEDILIKEDLLHHLQLLSNKVSERLQYKGYVGQQVQIMIKYYNFKQVNRSMTLDTMTDSKDKIYETAKYLLEKHWNHEAVRLLSVAVNNIKKKALTGEQISLFHYEEQEKNKKLIESVQKINKKYGKDVIVQANKLKPIAPTTSFNKDFLDED